MGFPKGRSGSSPLWSTAGSKPRGRYNLIGFFLYYFTKHIARNDPLGSPRQVMGMGGFTLIELLVVVAIVGVLATIALSSYVSYQQRAVDQQMINDLKNVTFAMESYFAEHYTYTSFVPDLVDHLYNDRQ